MSLFTCVHLCIIRVDSIALLKCQLSQGARAHTPTKSCTTGAYENVRVCSDRLLGSQDMYHLCGACVCVLVCLCLCTRHTRCRSRHKRTRAHATCLCVEVFMLVLTCAWFARSRTLSSVARARMGVCVQRARCLICTQFACGFLSNCFQKLSAHIFHRAVYLRWPIERAPNPRPLDLDCILTFDGAYPQIAGHRVSLSHRFWSLETFAHGWFLLIIFWL